MDKKEFTAKEFCSLFETGQYGRFYVVSNWDSGPVFRVQVLPEGEMAKPNGKPNLCLNHNAVLVYGEIVDEAGKKKSGWIHQGKWVDDFIAKANAKAEQIREKEEREAKAKEEREFSEQQRIAYLLSKY